VVAAPDCRGLLTSAQNPLDVVWKKKSVHRGLPPLPNGGYRERKINGCLSAVEQEAQERSKRCAHNLRGFRRLLWDVLEKEILHVL